MQQQQTTTIMTFLDILPLCAGFLDCDTIKALDTVSHTCHSLTPYIITQHVYETDLSENENIRRKVTELKSSITIKQFIHITTYELYIQPLLETLSSYVTSLQNSLLRWSRKEILFQIVRHNSLRALIDPKIYKFVKEQKILSKPIGEGLPTVASALYDLLLQPFCNWHWDDGRISVDPITDKCINLLPFHVLRDILEERGQMDDLRSGVILYNCNVVRQNNTSVSL